MNLRLDKQEKYFAFGALLYILFCIGFVLLFTKGSEVEYVSQHYSNNLFQFFTYVSKLAELPGILLFILVVYIKDKKQLPQYTLIALTTSLSILFFKHIIFPESNRPRVWANQQQIVLPMGASDLIHFSFPSGHTAFAFCLMYCIAHLFKASKATIIALVIALFVGFSRVYLLAHFVIDTGIGAIIGVVIGILGNKVYEALFNKNYYSL